MPIVTYVSKVDEKLLEMKPSFHLFLFAGNIFVVGDLDSEQFEDRNSTLF